MESLSQLLIPIFSEGASLLILWSWQSFLLLGLVWLMLWIGRVGNPAIRHRIWVFGVLAIAVLPPLTAVANKFAPAPPNETIATFVSMPRTVTATRAPAESATLGPTASSQMVPALAAFGWQTLALSALFAAWMVGTLVTFARFARTYLRFRRIATRAKARTDAELGSDDPRFRAFAE